MFWKSSCSKKLLREMLLLTVEKALTGPEKSLNTLEFLPLKPVRTLSTLDIDMLK